MDSPLPLEMFQKWVHSREEDTQSIKVYRPHTYNFPPSRGREGFEFQQNGTFVQYNIGPADGSQLIMGNWTYRGDEKIQVTLESEEQASYIIQIVFCDQAILKISVSSQG